MKRKKHITERKSAREDENRIGEKKSENRIKVWKEKRKGKNEKNEGKIWKERIWLEERKYDFVKFYM